MNSSRWATGNCSDFSGSGIGRTTKRRRLNVTATHVFAIGSRFGPPHSLPHLALAIRIPAPPETLTEAISSYRIVVRQSRVITRCSSVNSTTNPTGGATKDAISPKTSNGENATIATIDLVASATMRWAMISPHPTIRSGYGIGGYPISYVRDSATA